MRNIPKANKNITEFRFGFFQFKELSTYGKESKRDNILGGDFMMENVMERVRRLLNVWVKQH